ncbi:hypothetical protein CUC59_20190, partial [Acinetobacter baumannii]
DAASFFWGQKFLKNVFVHFLLVVEFGICLRSFMNKVYKDAASFFWGQKFLKNVFVHFLLVVEFGICLRSF